MLSERGQAHRAGSHTVPFTGGGQSRPTHRDGRQARGCPGQRWELLAVGPELLKLESGDDSTTLRIYEKHFNRMNFMVW